MGYIKWLGHAAFEVKLDKYLILIDPWLTNPLSPVKPSDYKENVDLIIVTHDHGDHLGESIELLRLNPRAKFLSVYEIANYVAERVGAQERVIGANIGGSIKVPEIDLRIALVPATHSSTRGVPCGVVLVGNEATIYHAGDTGLTAEMQYVAEIYRPSIAMLPIGGHFTMDVVEAAKAVEILKPDVVIPMHYNTFPLIKADPNEFKRIVEQKGLKTKVVILKPGETYTF